MKKTLLTAAVIAAAFGSQSAQAQEPQCELDRPIVFGALDWDSNAFHTALARRILEAGYGCETDSIPGSTLPLLAGMKRGDVDITMETWKENFKDAWEEGVDEGTVKDVGVNFPDSQQGWYVPRYLVEGEDAEAPDLKSVEDLPRYKELFRDPEEPSKGRFYNCILGWACEVINTKKLYAYGLMDDYTNFRPGTGAALSAAIASGVERRQPFVSYAWGPSWILGKYDLVMLEEPEYDEEIWAEMEAAGDPEDVTEATAYPEIPVYVGVNTKFAEQAPKIIEFLGKYETTNDLVSEALVYMQENRGAEADDAAVEFLRTQEDLWTEWVPEDVAERVRASL